MGSDSDGSDDGGSSEGEARGVLRTSIRPRCVPSSRVLFTSWSVGMSIDPESAREGILQSGMECLFPMTLLAGQGRGRGRAGVRHWAGPHTTPHADCLLIVYQWPVHSRRSCYTIREQ